MGRGRQKAKHTKVARNLKYFDPGTDLRRLEQELTGQLTPDYLADEDYDVEDDYDPAEDEDYAAWAAGES
jgi:hypothetical protein